jgi:hypothetical protein
LWSVGDVRRAAAAGGRVGRRLLLDCLQSCMRWLLAWQARCCVAVAACCYRQSHIKSHKRLVRSYRYSLLLELAT